MPRSRDSAGHGASSATATPIDPSERVARGTFGSDVVVSLFFYAALLGIALANNVAIARFVGPDGRGLYGLAVAIVALAGPIAAMGLPAATVYFIGRGEPPRAVAGLNLLLFGALAPLALGIAGTGMILLGTPPAEAMMFATVVAIAVIPASVYLECERSHFLARRRVLAFNLCHTALALLLLSLNLTTLATGTQWVLYNLLLSYWVVASALLLRRIIVRPTSPSRQLVRSSFRYGLRAATIRALESGVLRFDYLLMTPFVGLAEIGIYAIADQITHMMATVGITAGRFLFAESAADERGERTRAKLELASRLVLVLILVGALVAATSFWWLIPILFGTAFAPAYVGVLILIPASLMRNLYFLFSTYLAGQNLQAPAMRGSGAALAAEVALVVAGAMAFGWHGAAIAKSIATIIQFTWVYRAYRDLTREYGSFRWTLNRADLAILRGWLAARLPS